MKHTGFPGQGCDALPVLRYVILMVTLPRGALSCPRCVDEETGTQEVQVVTLCNLLFLLVEILVIFAAFSHSLFSCLGFA